MGAVVADVTSATFQSKFRLFFTWNVISSIMLYLYVICICIMYILYGNRIEAQDT